MDYNYNKKKHLQLLKLFLDLEKLNKNFYQENSENYCELNKYEISISEHIFWIRRKDFILLMEDFIHNIINFYEFETTFSLLYWKTTEEYDMFKRDLKRIEKFQPSSRSYGFASFIA